MPTLKAGHYYVNRQPKKSMHIAEIMPLYDIEVRQPLFDEYDDMTRTSSGLSEMVKFDCVKD